MTLWTTDRVAHGERPLGSWERGGRVGDLQFRRLHRTSDSRLHDKASVLKRCTRALCTHLVEDIGPRALCNVFMLTWAEVTLPQDSMVSHVFSHNQDLAPYTELATVDHPSKLDVELVFCGSACLHKIDHPNVNSLGCLGRVEKFLEKLPRARYVGASFLEARARLPWPHTTRRTVEPHSRR